MSGLVVIGGSYAGIQAALTAREAGYTKPVTVVTDEHWLPYERPPLSKDFLLNKMAEQNLILRDKAFFDISGIELVLGNQATEIDRRDRRVALDGDSTLQFDEL